jgi:programmed cell death protein 4
MDFQKKYDVDAMLNEASDDADVSDNLLTDDGGAKTKENGEMNLLKKPLTVEEHRALRRKLKKNLGRQNSKDGALGIAGTPNFIAPQRRWKNSRRSRNGQGRGLTKKAGGGRGNWGKFGSELLEEYESIDPADPNFNEDEDLENVKFEEIVCANKLNNEEEFLKNFEMVMLEYFEHGDTHEVAQEIDDNIRSGTLRPLVIRKAIEMAFEHKNSHREMTSVLISDLYGRCLIGSDYEHGFDMLLNNLPDLILDTPEAPHLLGNFLARAVADDCLMPKYVHQLAQNGNGTALKNGDRNGNDGHEHQAGRAVNEHAQQALNYAEGHLSMPNGWAHLDNVWGVAGGLRPVQNITKQMELLLKEYLLSREIQEAQRCIIALEVPHFHHELVYEIVIMMLEAKANEGIEEAMANLLQSLEQSCVLTIEMIEQGFQRVYDDLPDISLDIPLAYIILERFVQRCCNLNVLSEKMLKNLPTRGRKRFVSEGDSGLIKPSYMMFRDY